MLHKNLIFIGCLMLTMSAFGEKEFIFTNTGTSCKDVVLTSTPCVGVSHGELQVCYVATVCPGDAPQKYVPGWVITHVNPHALDMMYVFPEGSDNAEYSSGPVPYGNYDLKND